MAQTTLPSQKVVDFKTSPIFIGQTKFDPLPDAKNILITGGAGFIASFVVRHFTIQYPEYNIISYDKLDYCASTNNTLSLEDLPNFIFEKGDITGENSEDDLIIFESRCKENFRSFEKT